MQPRSTAIPLNVSTLTMPSKVGKLFNSPRPSSLHVRVQAQLRSTTTKSSFSVAFLANSAKMSSFWTMEANRFNPLNPCLIESLLTKCLPSLIKRAKKYFLLTLKASRLSSTKLTANNGLLSRALDRCEKALKVRLYELKLGAQFIISGYIKR